MKFNKGIYELCQRLVIQPEHPANHNASTKFISAEFGVGYPERITSSKSRFVLRDGDTEKLIHQIQLLHNLNLLTDEYSDQWDRVENSEHHHGREKQGSNASNDQILFNTTDGILRLNHAESRPLPFITSAGQQLGHRKITSIEHDKIIICENYTPMFYLSQFKQDLIFQDALVVYRGDSQKGQLVAEVNQFIQRFLGLMPIYNFGDYDPSGFNLVSRTLLDGYILPELSQFENYTKQALNKLGSTDKYSSQIDKHPLDEALKIDSLSEHIRFLKQHMLGFQQEALINQQVNWTLVQC